MRLFKFHSPKVIKIIRITAYGFGGGTGICPDCPPMSVDDFTVVAAACGMASAVHDISMHESARNEHIMTFFISLRI